MRRIDNSGLSNRASDGEILYPDSVGSSPRSSVGADKVSLSEEPLHVRWDEVRVKLMCSFGGRILPRPHDNQLRYVGGETRIVVVHRNIMYADLTAKLFKVFGTSLTIKYQLPSEDLDALISVTSDEDMENMMEEFDRLLLTTGRSSRLRLFLFPAQLDSQTSLSSLLNTSCNRENWFVDALNGMQIVPRHRSSDSSIVSEAAPDYLFGLDSVDEWAAASRSASNPPEHFPEKPAVASAALGSLLQGVAGELPNSAPGSPLKRLPTSLSTSSAPPAMMSLLSAAVDALKAESREPTSQATAVPQVTRDVNGQGSGLVSQESPTNQAPVVPQVPRDAINQGLNIGSQDLGREPTNQAAAVPQLQAPREDVNSQGSVPVYKGREAEKNETVEDKIPTNFTGAAGELISAGKTGVSSQLSEGLLNDMTHKPPATGSNSSNQEQLVESLTVQTQKVSAQQLSNPPAEMQQQRPLPELIAQAGKSSAAKQDPQSESAMRAGGKELLNLGAENQTISAAGGKETSKSIEEQQQVLENFRKLVLDDKVSSDPRANQPEKEQSNFEVRQVDSTIRAGADAIAQFAVASKMVGESRFVQMLSSYNTPMQGIEEGLRLPQASSPPLSADAYSSSMVPLPPLPSQGMMRPIVPTQLGGDGDNGLRSTFYQQQQQSAMDEAVAGPSRYATQGPAIKLPIMPSLAPAPVQPPLFARSDTSRTISRSPSPVAPPVHPQQQLMRQLQPTGVPLAHQPAGAPPLLSSNAAPPIPVTVYPPTSSQVEGVPMRGTPGIPVFTQFQRQAVNDPMQQFQRPASPYWEYHTSSALPSRFRPVVSSQQAQVSNQQAQVSNQQAQYDAKVNAGGRPATAVPSSRPSAAPPQLYNYYNMEQVNAYAAPGMQGTVLYDPVNGAYIVGPNNSGILPGSAPLANANPFVDDTSGIVGTYQDVPDLPSNLQQVPVATVAGDNRLPGRQFIMRN